MHTAGNGGEGSCVLVRCRVRDPAKGAGPDDAAIWVAGGRIARIGTSDEAAPEARRDPGGVIDLRGRHLAPGLVNCHTHFGVVHHGTADVQRYGSESDAELALRMAACARDALHAGVTTVRLVGEPRRADLALRSAVARGLVPGPRVVAAGRALTTTGGHGQGAEACEVDGADACRRAAREEIKAGADLLKVMLSGGVSDPPDKAGVLSMTGDELSAIVEVAHAWGKPVAAHCGTLASVKSALACGVDTIEHGYDLDAEAVATLVAEGRWLVPTPLVTRSEEFFARIGAPPEMVARMSAAGEVHRASLAAAVAAGVRIAAGTDFYPHEPFDGTAASIRELECLVEAGMRPDQALRAATSDAAALLGLQDEIGAVREGMAADLVAMPEDPTVDVSALRALDFVMREGQVVRPCD